MFVVGKTTNPYRLEFTFSFQLITNQKLQTLNKGCVRGFIIIIYFFFISYEASHRRMCECYPGPNLNLNLRMFSYDLSRADCTIPFCGNRTYRMVQVNKKKSSFHILKVRRSNLRTLSSAQLDCILVHFAFKIK